jgi:hypothetical protein
MQWRADDPALLARPWARWRLRETEPRPAANYVYDLVRGPWAPPPADAPLLFSGTAPPDLPCEVRQAGDAERYDIGRRATLVVGPDRARMTVVPGAEQLTASIIGFQPINMAAGRTGRMVLHCAALRPPGGGTAVLVFGKSGAGKTTSTLALIAGGWHFLSDDVAIVDMGRDPPRAGGLPLAFKVHRRTVELLPWLRTLAAGQWNREDEQPLEASAVSDALGLARPSGGSWPISGLVVLSRREADGHVVRPLDKSEALVAILADNIALRLTGIGPHHRLQAGRIAELVRRTPAFELRPGPDLASLAAALRGGLGPA